VDSCALYVHGDIALTLWFPFFFLKKNDDVLTSFYMDQGSKHKESILEGGKDMLLI